MGSLVVARFTEDGQFYRAKVEETDGRMFSVRYLDYGNQDCSLPASELLAWRSVLEMVPPQATPCCLYACPGNLTVNSIYLCEYCFHTYTLSFHNDLRGYCRAATGGNLPVRTGGRRVHQAGPAIPPAGCQSRPPEPQRGLPIGVEPAGAGAVRPAAGLRPHRPSNQAQPRAGVQ